MKPRIALALAATLAAAPALAHHSFAMFDMTKSVSLQGTIVSFKWSNPHAWLELDVPKAGGAADHWSIEMTSPNNLVNLGWKRSSLKPGDKTTIVVHPLRDGKNGGSLVQATTADGTVLGSATGQDAGGTTK